MDKRFYSRRNELGLLEELYSSNKFEMLILHGRRRVGKSYLLREFASHHSENTIFFTAEDNYFAFWFMFIYKKQSLLNGFISPEKYYEKYLTEENLNTFLGFRFEKICKEFITKKSYKDELSFYPEKIGKWWGTNPVTYSQDEIDIVR